MTVSRRGAEIDHLVLGSRDLAALSQWWFSRAGEKAMPGGAHTGRGTRNELVGLGATAYLELIGPDPEQPDPEDPRPFGVDLIESKEPVLLTFAAAVDDIDVAREKYRLVGVSTTQPFAMERVTPAGDLLAWRLSMPEAGSGTIPFLIEWGAKTVHPASGLSHKSRLSGLNVSHPDAKQTSDALASLGLDVAVASGPVRLQATVETPNGKVALGS